VKQISARDTVIKRRRREERMYRRIDKAAKSYIKKVIKRHECNAGPVEMTLRSSRASGIDLLLEGIRALPGHGLLDK
jgi:hypothetical protein